MSTRTIRALLALPLLLLASCGSAGITDPPPVVFPERDVSFNTHVKPVLLYSCALSGCHDSYTHPPAANLVLETYSEVVRNPGVVRPGDTTGSILAQVLRGRDPLHPPEPLRELTQNQRDGIIRWIFEGAFNN